MHTQHALLPLLNLSEAPARPSAVRTQHTRAIADRRGIHQQDIFPLELPDFATYKSTRRNLVFYQANNNERTVLGFFVSSHSLTNVCPLTNVCRIFI